MQRLCDLIRRNNEGLGDLIYTKQFQKILICIIKYIV